MVTQSLPRDAGAAGGGRLRPVNPARDLRAIARLIEVAFAEELSPGGHAVMRELQTLSLLSPLLWMISQFSPALDDLLSGFVWEENGTIVGNTTLTRAEGHYDHWIISNVAVLPEYRRKGIARALVAAAIKHARERHARQILLQVRADNLGARQLYYTLGFQTIEAVAELQALHPTLPRHAPNPHLTIQHPSRAHWHDAYEVARAAVPGAVQRVRPLRPANFQVSEPDLFSAIGEFFSGHRRVRRWARLGDRISGLVTVDAQRGSFSRAEWVIHPDARGKVEHDLVRVALEALAGERLIRANVPTYDQPLIDALLACGFYEIRTLEQMVLEPSRLY